MIRLFFNFYLLLASCMTIYALAEPYIREDLLRDLFVQQDVKEFAGLFYLMDELYETAGDESFHSTMASYPGEQILPAIVLKLNDAELSEGILRDLNAGEIHVADIHGPILYSRISESNTVVKVGPLGLTPELNRARLTYKYLLYAVLALPIFLWLYNLKSKTRRLEAAASHFGNGDFSARASEEGKYRVGNLNQTFNFMAERVERLIQGHKSLTNAVAHELRTPVSRVRFQLDMLYQESDDNQRKEYMHGISDDIDELSDLVDELLTYARFDREPMANSMDVHSLHESINNVIGTRHFDSSLTVNYDESWYSHSESLQLVQFDPKNLERAIGNLVSNAEKYAQSSINISVKRTDENCKVIVDDDGPGIPLAQRNGIFEPFRRLDDSRTRSTGGYGLGLAIVKQIAQWHKGTITIGESPTGGARFVFSWPVK